jgi:hypothetical protein
MLHTLTACIEVGSMQHVNLGYCNAEFCSWQPTKPLRLQCSMPRVIFQFCLQIGFWCHVTYIKQSRCPFPVEDSCPDAGISEPPPSEIVEGLRNPYIDQFLPKRRKEPSKLYEAYKPLRPEYFHLAMSPDMSQNDPDMFDKFLSDLENVIRAGAFSPCDSFTCELHWLETFRLQAHEPTVMILFSSAEQLRHLLVMFSFR